MRFLLPLSLSILAVACDSGGDAVDDATNADIGSVASDDIVREANVVITDEIQADVGVTTDVGFWSHPTLPYNGLLIAAGDAGLASFNIEFGEPIQRLSTRSIVSLDTVYLGVGPEAIAILIASTPNGHVEAYSFDNLSRQAGTVATASFQLSPATGLCAHAVDNSAQGFLIANGSARPIALMGNVQGGFNLSIEDGASYGENLIDCAINHFDGETMFLDANGDLLRIDGDGSLSVFAATDASKPHSIDLVLSKTEQNETVATYAVLDASTGTLTLVDNAGSKFATVSLASSFDYSAAASASGFGIGYGNYGGIYRNGMIAIAGQPTVDGQPSGAISLGPWNGLAEALNRPLNGSVDPRSPTYVEEEESLIEIPVREP